MDKMKFLILFLILSGFAVGSLPFGANAQSDLEPKAIAVETIVSDVKIQKRLNDILAAVGAYEQIEVKVHSGVVILSGWVDDERQDEWVQNLATRMDGVVAVQSQIKVRPKEVLDLTPAREEIEGFSVAFMRSLPTIVLSLSVLAISVLLFFLATFGIRRTLSKKISSPLLLGATAKFLAVPVFFIGLYLALKISGLAGLAFTVLGGTGLLGLAFGLGLKNSFEDYAASILLSIKKPFRANDWVKIGEYEGIVQKVTSRSTLIIDFDGNHVLMPNSLVYRSVVTNKTANPKMRFDFDFGLDYGDSIEAAQAAVLELLSRSELVLKDPEPWVLVDQLATSTVNLRVYFWLNVREVSRYKVSSYLLLEIKNLLLAKGFRFPDPQREIVFTNHLVVGREAPAPAMKEMESASAILSPASVQAESIELNRQARDSDLPDQGESVL